MKKLLTLTVSIIALLLLMTVIASAHNNLSNEYTYDDLTPAANGTYVNTAKFHYPGRTAYVNDETTYNDVFLTPEEDGTGNRLTLKGNINSNFGFGVKTGEIGPYTGTYEIKATVKIDDIRANRHIGAYDCWHSSTNPTIFLVTKDGYFYLMQTELPGSYKAKAGSTYDIVAKIDSITGNCRAVVYEDGKEFFSVSKTWTEIKGYKWTGLYMYQNGYTSKTTDGTLPVAVSHWDNVSIKNINRFYSFDNYYDFEAYTGNEAGNAIPTGFSRVIYVDSKCDTANGEIKRLFVAETDEKGKCLNFVETKQGTSSEDALLLDFDAQKNFGSYFTDAYLLEFSLMRNDNRANIIVRTDGEKSNLLEIYQSGWLNLLGNETGIRLSETGKWYDIKVRFSIPNASAHIEVYNEGELVASWGGKTKNQFPSVTYTDANGEVKPCVKNIYIGYNRHYPITEHTSFYLDDFRITGAQDVYAPSEEGYTAFDIAYSTPGSTNKIVSGQPVKVTFNNKIDKSTFTSSAITVNAAAVDASAISFDDDYTVNLAIETQPSKHYHIAFTNVADLNGTTLSDYIEFDTLLPAYELGSVKFYRENAGEEEILSVTTPGVVNATFTGHTNNGLVKRISCYLALYSDGELVAFDHENVLFDEDGEAPVLTVTIPDDGNSYTVKMIRVDERNLMPYEKTAMISDINNQQAPIAIIKLDDLGATNLSVFNDLEKFAEEENIKLAFGMIANSFDEGASDEQIAALASFGANPYIEVWCHGYDHAGGSGLASEFRESKENQRKTFEDCIRVAAKAGITLKTLNPGFGELNNDTIELLEEEFTDFTTVMFMSEATSASGIVGGVKLEASEKLNGLWNGYTLENGTYTDRVLPIDEYKAAYEKIAEGRDYILIQGHPAQWGESGIAKFKAVVDYLKSLGTTFMTPAEYTELSK